MRGQLLYFTGHSNTFKVVHCKLVFLIPPPIRTTMRERRCLPNIAVLASILSCLLASKTVSDQWSLSWTKMDLFTNFSWMFCWSLWYLVTHCSLWWFILNNWRLILINFYHCQSHHMTDDVIIMYAYRGEASKSTSNVHLGVSGSTDGRNICLSLLLHQWMKAWEKSKSLRGRPFHFDHHQKTEIFSCQVGPVLGLDNVLSTKSSFGINRSKRYSQVDCSQYTHTVR